MKLINPPDIHLHLRDMPMLKRATPYSVGDFKATIIMSNLIPPLCDLNALKACKSRIVKASENELFTPLMTLFLQHYGEKFLEETRGEIFDIKLHPAGITTNSSGGVSGFDSEALKPILLAVGALEIPLLVYNKTNDSVMNREANFARIYEELALNFPKLKIVMEHTTTKTLCKLLRDYKNLYTTITLHRLILSLDDVIGDKMQSHLFCRPVAKTYEDREALCELAFSGYEKAVFESDSAPYPQNKKEYCGYAAGVFSSPMALSVSTELLERNSDESNLQRFLSNNTYEIRKLSFQKDKIIELKKEEWQVEENYHEIVPFMAEKCLEFKPFILE